jgi:hypothetical protein
VRLGVASLVALAALVASAPAHASTPMPWCGTTPESTDRLPDAAAGFAIHFAYVRPVDSPDRFAEFAPRIVGDAAAIDAWWRSQDGARTPRFDVFPVACASAFGALDITNVVLAQGITSIGTAFSTIRRALVAEADFFEAEKSYVVYYDGPTGQTGQGRVCGQGAPPGAGATPGFAVVYIDSCRSDSSDVTRPVIGVHELVHVFGAVDDEAPHLCNDGHVCDVANDLLAASLSGGELETHVLDGGRDDYYGHDGRWTDVQDSFFLERLDSPDRTAPTTPTGVVAREDPSGLVLLSWRASRDDLGPISYRVYRDALFVRQVPQLSALLASPASGSSLYSVRAVDAVGRLSPPVGVRFNPAVGIVDEQGKLVRDTVKPPAIVRVDVRRTAKAVTLSWPTVRDAGGVRGYRVTVGTRTLVVAKPKVTLAKSRLRSAVSIAAVDRAGNIGPPVIVPLRRLR